MASLRDEAEKAKLIGLPLSRGHVMHPADWFAAALGLAEQRLLALLPPQDDEAGAMLQTMAAETGSVSLLPALLDRALADELHEAALTALVARLDRDQRLRMVAAQMRHDADPLFRVPLRLAASDPGGLTLKQIDGPRITALLATVPVPTDEPPQARQARERILAASLAALGMLADAGAAAVLIERFVAGGLSIADPRLDALRLNAMLLPGRTP